MDEDMIRLEHVVKMYDNGKRAINDVSLRICPHERAVIHGISGSGKTTLFKLMAGIEKPSAGNIFADGKAVHEMSVETAADFRNRTFGLLTRRPGFMDTLTMLGNISLPLAIRKMPADKCIPLVMEYMDMLGIANLAHNYPPRLSAFELQLAGLARALAMQPKILMLHNMEADLTAKENQKIQSLLHMVWESEGLTMIRLTDRVEDKWIADRFFRLEYGKIYSTRETCYVQEWRKT